MNFEPTVFGLLFVFATTTTWAIRTIPWRRLWRWFCARVVHELRQELRLHTMSRTRHVGKDTVDKIAKKLLEKL